jgi:RNA polymerase sigma-70 factor, ECF subfamily
LQFSAKIRARQRRSPRTPSPSTKPPRAGKPLKPDAAALKEAIRLAQQGDATAFETIYELHSRRVYALCLRMTGDPVEAEDLTQEAFLQVFRKIHTFRGESAFSSWLHSLTANLVLMRFRRKRPVSLSLDEMTRPNDEKGHHAFEIGIPDPRLSGLFDRIDIHAALDQLPQGYKSMFLLHDVQGYEHNEIASMLGCSVGNSKSQLHKARKRLRELLHEARHYASRHLPGIATTSSI